MHLKRENIHIYVSSLLKYKMHLHLRDSIEGHLHYITVKFKVRIYICIAVRDSLTQEKLPLLKISSTTLSPIIFPFSIL
jgi:hypothetical protein